MEHGQHFLPKLVFLTLSGVVLTSLDHSLGLSADFPWSGSSERNPSLAKVCEWEQMIVLNTFKDLEKRTARTVSLVPPLCGVPLPQSHLS